MYKAMYNDRCRVSEDCMDRVTDAEGDAMRTMTRQVYSVKRIGRSVEFTQR